MQKDGRRITYSASDVAWQVACPHRTRLRVAEVNGLFRPVKNTPNASLDLAVRYGEEYEREVLNRLRSEHGRRQVAEVRSGSRSAAELERASEVTRRFLSDKRRFIYQGVLVDGDLICIPDFIELAEDGEYQVWDVKLSRSVEPEHRIQVTACAAALARTLGRPQQPARLLLGDGTQHTVHATDAFSKTNKSELAALVTCAREDLALAIQGPVRVPDPDWGTAKKDDCERCTFRDHCAVGRVRDRDLSLVLGMRPSTRSKLIDGGIRTIDHLAAASEGSRPKGVLVGTFAKTQAQARIQVQGETGAAPVMVNGLGVEVFAPEAMADLLPAPDPFDIFFDTEGFSFAEHGEGIEYLFGWTRFEDGSEVYRHRWGDSVKAERAIYTAFVHQMLTRWKSHPRMHIYHFHHHETDVLRRMASRHGTSGAELQQLLDQGVFVDLRKVVKAGMRTSAGSLGLKALEPLYMTKRSGAVASAVDSMAEYQKYLDLRVAGDELGAERLKTAIVEYNRVDCESTRKLRDWLERTVGNARMSAGPPGPSSPDAQQRSVPRTSHSVGRGGGGGTPPPPSTRSSGPGRIEPVDLQAEMKRSYLDYAMSVIVSRALPDVRDGLKPVHRRVIYAMYDGGYRPDRGFFKCARVVGDVMGNYHPHGDSAIYDTLVRLAQPWSLRYPLVDGQGNFGSPGNDPAAAMRYTESRMAQLAIEMVRDIDEETVDFVPNYDGKTAEPVILPSRFPNLLVNGSAGIAVGMATNIPPHDLREVAAGVQWALAHPEAGREELLAALLERIKGPDFPTGALIVGRRGIDEAYRTGRGSIIMRAVVEVDEDRRGRQLLVVKELPYQVNPDNLLLKIAELVGDGRLTGIADVRDDSSSRTGMRLVIELKRDAVAQVVLNNLYKHTQLQDTFGASMLALVDGVPRTLTLDAFVSHWISHQIEVVQRRTRYRLRKAEERAHILRGYLKALDAIEQVIALIRRSPTVEDARVGLVALLDIDGVQATAILGMQLRGLAALERQKIVDEYGELMVKVADWTDILARPERQRTIISEELAVIVEKFGDDRRTKFAPFESDTFVEDFIA